MSAAASATIATTREGAATLEAALMTPVVPDEDAAADEDSMTSTHGWGATCVAERCEQWVVLAVASPSLATLAW